jgi:hypothetical protein
VKHVGRARGLAFVLALAAAGSVAGCAGKNDPAMPPPAVAQPAIGWYEASVDETHDFVVTLSPHALAADPTYGPIFRRASQLAATRVQALVGSTTLEAFEGADDVVVAVREAKGPDAVIVVAGVPSEIDPAKLVDTDGRPLWRMLHDGNGRDEGHSRVAEFLPREAEARARLFVLPGRTWVIGVGEGAFRVGSALSHATVIGPYLPDPRPPIVVHLRGEILELIRARTQRALAPIADRLLGVTFALTAGGEGQVLATFTYADDRAATRAELRGREVIDALAEKMAPRLDFMRAAEIKRSKGTVELKAKLPPALLRRFADADAAAL